MSTYNRYPLNNFDMSTQFDTLSSNQQTTNVMKISRRVDTATKYMQSTSILDHTIQCTKCDNKQDFDNMAKLEAKKAIIENGWREGVDADKEAFCLCPECVEEHGSTESENKNSNKLSEVDYD